jgi:hypothetical protein
MNSRELDDETINCSELLRTALHLPQQLPLLPRPRLCLPRGASTRYCGQCCTIGSSLASHYLRAISTYLQRHPRVCNLRLIGPEFTKLARRTRVLVQDSPFNPVVNHNHRKIGSASRPTMQDTSSAHSSAGSSIDEGHMDAAALRDARSVPPPSFVPPSYPRNLLIPPRSRFKNSLTINRIKDYESHSLMVLQPF